MAIVLLAAMMAGSPVIDDWEKLMPDRTLPSDFEYGPSSVRQAASGTTIWARMKLVEYQSESMRFVTIGDETPERATRESIASGAIGAMLAEVACRR